MPERQERIVVARKLADCFRYFADFSTCEQWDPGVYRAEKITAGPPRPGSKFALQLNFLGRHVPMDYWIETIEAPERITLAGAGDGFTATDDIRLSACAEGTAIDYRVDVQLTNIGRHLGPLLDLWMRRMTGRAAAGIERALTVDTQPPRLGLGGVLADRTLLPAAWSFTERGYIAMRDQGLSEFMDGRTVAITGATGGIGLAAACELAQLGARVLLLGRNASRLEAARDKVLAFAGCPAAQIGLFEADLADLGAARRLANQIAAAAPELDVLINNAGALFAERGETAQGHERALAINLLAPYALTEALLPNLRAAGGRVVNVASGGMYMQALALDDMQFRNQAYDGSKAYARAKRGLAAMTAYWAEHEHDGVTFNAMHPGWAATPGVARSLPGFNRALGRWLRDARMGADTIVWLASAAAVANTTGQFWLDRRPHPTAVLPGTAVSESQRERLAQWLADNV